MEHVRIATSTHASLQNTPMGLGAKIAAAVGLSEGTSCLGLVLVAYSSLMRSISTEEANLAFQLKKRESQLGEDAVWDFLAHQGGSIVGGVTRGPLLGVDG